MCKMELEVGDYYSTPRGDIRVESVETYPDGYVEVRYYLTELGMFEERAAIFLRILIAKGQWVWKQSM